MYKFTATVIEYCQNSVHAALSVIGCFLSAKKQTAKINDLLFRYIDYAFTASKDNVATARNV